MAKRNVPNACAERSRDFISFLWPRLMSVATAAKYYDTNPRQMDELVRSGTLHVVKEGCPLATTASWIDTLLRAPAYAIRGVRSAAANWGECWMISRTEFGVRSVGFRNLWMS